jgi:mono/diheme cytochrome c family protein
VKTRSVSFAVLCCGALTVAWLESSCGSARRPEPLKGSVKITDPKVSLGRVVFMEKCQRCHPGGEAGLGPALNDKPLPPFLMKTQIRVGLGAMPSFSRAEISDDGVDAVIAYLKAIRRADAKPVR